MLATFSFACASWIWFRARTLDDALTVYERIGAGPWTLLTGNRALGAPAHLLALVIVLLALEWLARRHWHPLRLDTWPRPLRRALYTVLIWVTLGLSPEIGGSFIYFQF
jgi:hypothetical protein